MIGVLKILTGKPAERDLYEGVGVNGRSNISMDLKEIGINTRN